MTLPADVVVHVIDDDDEQRDALAGMLRSRGLRVMQYASARAFLDVPAPPPHCVVTDIRMPGMTGLELQRLLRQRGAQTPVVFMTGFADVAMAVEAMREGAIDFVEKPFEPARMFAAVARAAAATGRKGNASGEHDAATRVARLALREKQVLELLVAGLPNKSIAEELGLSVRTVEGYRSAMMQKLKAASLSEAVRIALAAGMTANRLA